MIQTNTFAIGRLKVGPEQPVFIVAELSANHNQDFDLAMKTVRAAKDAGADAIKLQTYTPDTMTLSVNRPCFQVRGGTRWDGRTLHDLYSQAYMPWGWQPKLKALANSLGMELFSSAFDATAVDFLEQMDVPVHKIASFELVDLPLIEKMAGTGKPLILSTGMATLAEIEEAVQTARRAGAKEVALLKCTSAYPSPAEEMNLRTIPTIADRFGLPVGLSDHTMGISVPVAAVALGACVVEKHFILSRSVPGPDSGFSIEPQEFKAMVEAIRTTEKALGSSRFGPNTKEATMLPFRRSLFVVEKVRRGEVFTARNVRPIRPANGLHPRYFSEVLGHRAAADIERGTPLTWELVEGLGSRNASP